MPVCNWVGNDYVLTFMIFIKRKKTKVHKVKVVIKMNYVNKIKVIIKITLFLQI